MRLSGIAYKPFVTAGLTGVMFAQSVLAPISAIAEGTGTETDAAHIDYQKTSVDTSFSSAAKRLIQRAQNVSSMSVEEAKQLLAGAQALLDRADAAADDASAADSAAGKTVDAANANVTSAQTGVDSADAAVSAELEFHVDALKKKLADAKAKAEELEKQKADAESKKADLENQQKTAQDEADKLQKQLNDANAKLEEAQKKLDALGENPAADEQAAYDEAKKAYDDAVADQASKKQAADDAQTKLADLNSQLASKKSELDAANATLASKKQAAADAASKLDAAKANYAGAVEAVKGDILADAQADVDAKQQAVDAAQKKLDGMTEGDEGYDAAKSALDAAQSALDSANAAYQSKLETAGSEAESEAQAKIDEAQAAKDKADAAVTSAEKTIADTSAQIASVEAQIATEQQKLTDANEAAADAAAKVTSTKQAMDDAKTALDKLADEQAKWDEQEKQAQENVDTAQGLVDAAKTAKAAADKKVTDLESQVSDVQKQIDDLKNQSGEATTQAVDDFCDFLAWLNKKTQGGDNGSDCYDALGYLALAAGGGWRGEHDTGTSGVAFDSYTHLGDKDDATYLDNFLKALDMIDQLNEIRKAEGLSEVKVSLGLTVYDMFGANWSAETDIVAHPKSYGYGCPWSTDGWVENAAWGYTAADGPNDFFTGWYYQEKANYTKADVTDPYTGMVYSPDEGGETGHYENIIDPDWTLTGMAYAMGGRYGNGSVAMNDFGVGNYIYGDADSYTDKAYTTAELRELIAEAKREGVTKYTFADGGITYADASTTDKQLKELEDKLADLQTQLDEAKGDQVSKNQALQLDQEMLAAAKKDLADLGERPTSDSLQKAYDDAKAAYDQAVADKAAADEKAADTKTEVDASVSKLNAQKAELETKLTTAQGELEGLKKSATDAAAALDAAKKDNQAVVDAGTAYRTAKANAETASKAVSDAQATVDTLNTSIDELTGKVADAQSAYDAAKKAADAAGPTAEQTEAYTSAKAALDAANAELKDLTDARDEAKKVADEAEAAKKANDELLTKLAGEISANETELDTISADIAEANAKASAWESVFDQQDAEDIVKNGFTGTTDDVEIADVLDFAHGSYEDKVKELEKAKAALDAAKAALDEAKADKATTADKLAAAEVDYALAKDAYDKVKSEVDALLAKQQPTDDAAGTTSMVKQAGVKTASDGKAEAGSSLPQTGDASGATVAATAAAGLSMVGVAEILRRRRAQQR